MFIDNQADVIPTISTFYLIAAYLPDIGYLSNIYIEYLFLFQVK